MRPDELEEPAHIALRQFRREIKEWTAAGKASLDTKERQNERKEIEDNQYKPCPYPLQKRHLKHEGAAKSLLHDTQEKRMNDLDRSLKLNNLNEKPGQLTTPYMKDGDRRQTQMQIFAEHLE